MNSIKDLFNEIKKSIVLGMPVLSYLICGGNTSTPAEITEKRIDRIETVLNRFERMGYLIDKGPICNQNNKKFSVCFMIGSREKWEVFFVVPSN